MKISIVIPTYNRPGLALNLGGQIRKYEKKVEIIVVDQSDTEESLKKFSKLNIKYIRNSQVNTAVAKNIGIEEASGEVIVFFDDDVEITSETIIAHVEEYKNQSVLGVAGRVINDGEVVPENTNVETGTTNKFLTAFTINFWGTRKQTVQFPYGCNMSFRKTALVKVGGFDNRITPPGFEEYDLGLRISKIGHIIFSPKALTYHHRAKTGGNRLSKKDWFNKYYWNYGRLVGKLIGFPYFIYSLLRISARILKEYPPALLYFYQGFFSEK